MQRPQHQRDRQARYLQPGRLSVELQRYHVELQVQLNSETYRS